MKTSEYKAIESYMRQCMRDSAHDTEHVMRVLYTALHLAETESGVDCDILIAACLLHDIARGEQFADPSVCHAAEGAEMAESLLLGLGWDDKRARNVRDCIKTHRFRSGEPPVSIEARILFDADKLEAAGALGIARTLMYKGHVEQPLYTLSGVEVCPGTGKDSPASFYKEYNFKLKNVESKLFTQEARKIARYRGEISALFFERLAEEVKSAYLGKSILEERLET